MRASTLIRYASLMVFGGFCAHLGFDFLTWQFYVLLALALIYGAASVFEVTP